MKKHGVKVVLNISKLSVPNLINRARHYVDSVISNPQIFISPSPDTVTLSTAIDDLEVAWNDAEDGGKTKKAIMHNKESDLRKLLTDFGNYVQSIANGDPSVINLAGMTVKMPPIKHNRNFSAQNGTDHGCVKLQVKAAAVKTMYKWQYRKDQDSTWSDSDITSTAVTNIGPLDLAMRYWFRVVFIQHKGENIPYEPISIIVV